MDLFSNSSKATSSSSQESYNAADIEVLEGLEPVRRRPGMYIGGTDETALHHLVTEVLDNAMDEAVAGHATRILFNLHSDGTVSISDNGRGIPVDPHPKFPDKSALEVILTTLHSGGKFSSKAYSTAGGLHGVGISVVCALSDRLEVEVVRDLTVWRQHYARGNPLGPIEAVETLAPSKKARRGTTIRFHPDPEIFDTGTSFRPARLFALAKAKAYLFRGVEIVWSCDPEMLSDNDTVPANMVLHFPGGLADFLSHRTEGLALVTPQMFSGEAQLPSNQGKIEWAITWSAGHDGTVSSYCNTIHTPQGGTHEQGFRQVLLKGLRSYGEMVGNKKAAQITVEDVFEGAFAALSVFIRDPQFQGQTKEKLQSKEATRLVENALKDRFDHWLTGNKTVADALLLSIIERYELRLLQKNAREVSRKTITQRIRLPGKLTDCTRDIPQGTEIFLVEGDSAGGSAKKARIRETQAVLPLRGKILNVASSSFDKIQNNQVVSDIALALGCGTGKQYKHEALRYERVIIMTDADVDGAHIASLLMTYFFREMPELVRRGNLYLAKPPLYRIVHAGKASYYARNDAEKEKLVAQLAKKPGKIEISRFKGLGEMSAEQLRETTMDPNKRTLLHVSLPEDMHTTIERVESLMGKKPELRFQFIQEQALSKAALLLDSLDI